MKTSSRKRSQKHSGDGEGKDSYLEELDFCGAAGDTEETLSVKVAISESLDTVLYDQCHLSLAQLAVFHQRHPKYWSHM